MYPTYNGFPGSDPMLPYSSQSPENPNQYQFNQLSTDFDFLSHQFTVPPESGDLLPLVSVSKDGEFLSHDGKLSPVHSAIVAPEAKSVSYDEETVFKFLNHMLMEDENTIMCIQQPR